MKNETTILVFKTNIARKRDLKQLKPVFESRTEVLKWNVDLDDDDKVLRIESTDLAAETVENLLLTIGFKCSELKS